MKYFKFKKNQDHYKVGHVFGTEKENKLLKQYIKDGIVEATSKPKEEKKGEKK